MKINVNNDLCIGCGTCTMLCEEAFELEDGKSQVIKGADLEKNQACINQAIDACPVGAISVKK